MEDRVGGDNVFYAMEDGKESAAGPLQCMYLAKSNAETSAECSRSVHSWKPGEQEESKKEFESRRHALESLHKLGILPLAPTKPATHNF